MKLALLEVKLAAVKILQEYTVTTTSETQVCTPYNVNVENSFYRNNF